MRQEDMIAMIMALDQMLSGHDSEWADEMAAEHRILWDVIAHNDEWLPGDHEEAHAYIATLEKALDVYTKGPKRSEG